MTQVWDRRRWLRGTEDVAEYACNTHTDTHVYMLNPPRCMYRRSHKAHCWQGVVMTTMVRFLTRSVGVCKATCWRWAALLSRNAVRMCDLSNDNFHLLYSCISALSSLCSSLSLSQSAEVTLEAASDLPSVWPLATTILKYSLYTSKYKSQPNNTKDPDHIVKIKAIQMSTPILLMWSKTKKVIIRFCLS